ncbi:MAG: hypothetical protein IPK63_17765 [Candidatus Competibacteraceae bacterium]|nr:hypothetical protein [Candidatus Competibacteraceae bacterium]
MTKGTLSAITALRVAMPSVGPRRLWIIRASLAPSSVGLSAAGGPPGMIVGAIFSMVGQILSFFAPAIGVADVKDRKALERLKGPKRFQKDITTVYQAIERTLSLRQADARRASSAMDGDQPLVGPDGH